MESSLQVLGIPREIVEFERSTGSLKNLLAMAERNYKGFSREYHSDLNQNPGAAAIFIRITDAINDLRNPDGLEHAVDIYVGEADRQQNLRRQETAQEYALVQKSLRAVFGLLPNLDQFSVFGVVQPTSYLLQFEAARAVLDVVAHNRVVLSISTPNLDMLPVQTDHAEYVNGRWREAYFDGRRKKWLDFQVIPSEPVSVVGFVPARFMRYQSSDPDFETLSSYSQLGEGAVGYRTRPDWQLPSEAWFVPYLEPKHEEGSEVVVRNRTGFLAHIGSIQAQAFFHRKR